MKAYRCERCGAIYNQKTDRAPYLIYRPNKNAAGRDVPVDLCEKCSGELFRWFLDGKREAKNE